MLTENSEVGSRNIYQDEYDEMDTGVSNVLEVGGDRNGRFQVFSPPEVDQEHPRYPQDGEKSFHVKCLIFLVGKAPHRTVHPGGFCKIIFILHTIQSDINFGIK